MNQRKNAYHFQSYKKKKQLFWTLNKHRKKAIETILIIISQSFYFFLKDIKLDQRTGVFYTVAFDRLSHRFSFPRPGFSTTLQIRGWKIILLYVALYYFWKNKDYLVFLCFRAKVGEWYELLEIVYFLSQILRGC